MLLAQGLLQPVAVQAVDRRVADDGEGLRFRQIADVLPGPVQQAVFNMNIVGIFS